MASAIETADSSLEIGEVHTRFTRQMDFVPSLSLQGRNITVIGLGAIGRGIALMLAAIGVRKMTLIDFDSVTPTNVTTQGFLQEDVGVEKVQAVERAIKAIDRDIEVNTIYDRFRPRYEIGEIAFLCVDSITARTAIYNSIKDKVKLMIDGRMLGEVWRVLTVHDDKSHTHYKKTLFPPEEQAEGRCTGHATIYSAYMPACWMVHQLTRYLRKLPLDTDTECNMLASELLPVTTA